MYPSSLKMRTISSLSFDEGTSSDSRLEAMALRSRVKRSETGSFILNTPLLVSILGRATGKSSPPKRRASPARFRDARDFAGERELAEADPAKVELAEISPRTAATLAT